MPTRSERTHSARAPKSARKGSRRKIQPTHATCKKLSEDIRNKRDIASSVYKAHVPEFVGRNGELTYKTIPITKESCERVAAALKDKSERVPRPILLAHVPEHVSHEGEILFTQPEIKSEDDYIVDLENGFWVGLASNKLIFGNYEGDEEIPTFQSMYLAILPTEEEVTAIGDLLAGGIEPATAQSALRDLQRAKAKTRSRERSKSKLETATA